eukprot:354827-Chlamydomonas_euryale.AAC.3
MLQSAVRQDDGMHAAERRPPGRRGACCTGDVGASTKAPTPPCAAGLKMYHATMQHCEASL